MQIYNFLKPIKNQIQVIKKTKYHFNTNDIKQSLETVKYGPGAKQDKDLVNLSIHIQNKMKELSQQEIKGKLATYIPELSQVNPNNMACAICTIDGKQISIGQDDIKFTMQSCIKPFTYLIACSLLDRANVHKFVGKEPSGQRFNSFRLNYDNLPYNPMINAGAITCASLIKPELDPQERFNFFFDYLEQILKRDEQQELEYQNHVKQNQFGEIDISMKYDFSYKTYLSEKLSGSRNVALAHFLNGERVFGKQLSFDQVQKNLNFYFENCCIQANINTAATLAATIANAGISPINGKRYFTERHTVSATQIMFSCGMYNYSGNWACNVGIPAKSGVSGLVIAVIPNLMGIAFLSPPLDKLGNSDKGIQFYEWLAEEFHFNIFQALLQNNVCDNPFGYWKKKCSQPYQNNDEEI